MRLFQSAIPDEAAVVACKLIGCSSPLRIVDLEPLTLLRTAGRERLLDADRLEREVLPHLGLNGDLPGLFPPDMQQYLGRGIEYWQYPCQLAPFLTALARFPVRSYLEVGVMHGGTFALVVDYLNSVSRLDRACAVDIMRVPSLRRFARRRNGVQVLRVDSGSERFAAALARSGGYDVAFIDGDHSYDGVRRDFETVRPHSQIMVFHDIVDAAAPGVRQFWRELKKEMAEAYVFEEFTAQYPSVRAEQGQDFLGIGMMVPRTLAQRASTAAS